MKKDELIDLYNKLKKYRSEIYVKRNSSSKHIFMVLLDIEEELYFRFNYEIEDYYE